MPAGDNFHAGLFFGGDEGSGGGFVFAGLHIATKIVYFCGVIIQIVLITKKIRYMTRIVLEVPQDKDLDLLLALLERLNIRVIQRTSEKKKPAPTKDDQAFILKGLPAREDFEAFVRDFEESRQDRPLPGRGN